jgi:hypothetical protein
MAHKAFKGQFMYPSRVHGLIKVKILNAQSIPKSNLNNYQECQLFYIIWVSSSPFPLKSDNLWCSKTSQKGRRGSLNYPECPTQCGTCHDSAATAASELPGNELVTKQNIAIA